jgi:hypothetical protein
MPRGTAAAAWNGGGLLFDPEALMGRVLAILGTPPAEAPNLQEHAP